MQEFKTAELFKPKPNTLQYGISPLHAWIRFFECIVHISYRCDLCKWQIRGTSKKKILLCRKKKYNNGSLKIVENTVLPIGYFVEEGSEARHKVFKQDRQFHARKTSRKKI